MLGNLKAITSGMVASPCVLKLENEGQVDIVNRTELSQFSAHFIGNNDQAQACNYATFLPFGEEAPLQVCLTVSFYSIWIRLRSVYHCIKIACGLGFP